MLKNRERLNRLLMLIELDLNGYADEIALLTGDPPVAASPGLSLSPTARHSSTRPPSAVAAPHDYARGGRSSSRSPAVIYGCRRAGTGVNSAKFR